MNINEPITITPHWGDHARDAFHGVRVPHKLELAQLFVAGSIIAAVVVAII